MLHKQILAALIAVTLVSGTSASAYAGVITTRQALTAEARASTEEGAPA